MKTIHEEKEEVKYERCVPPSLLIQEPLQVFWCWKNFSFYAKFY